MDTLGTILDSLCGTTTDLRTATAGYGDDLEMQIGDIANPANPRDLVASLAVLTKAMLTRTRKVEIELRERESDLRPQPDRDGAKARLEASGLSRGAVSVTERGGLSGARRRLIVTLGDMGLRAASDCAPSTRPL